MLLIRHYSRIFLCDDYAVIRLKETGVGGFANTDNLYASDKGGVSYWKGRTVTNNLVKGISVRLAYSM